MSNYGLTLIITYTLHCLRNCHSLRLLMVSYYLWPFFNCKCNAHAIITQLITQSGKQLSDVWVFKTTLGSAPNWQACQSPKLPSDLPKKTWLAPNSDCTMQSERCPFRKWTFRANGEALLWLWQQNSSRNSRIMWDNNPPPDHHHHWQTVRCE